MNEKVVKAKAKVKWFSDEKGFGFLIVEGYPKDVFVHKQQLEKSNISSIQEGDDVLCVVNQGIKGHYATSLDKE